ncbi:MAG: SHOCT domain-containing protein [Mycoplasmataceae bacterium]|jgi:hypothetical protein|nr:SHOCT domain-containing protein [Mycoplasmataceae bacterium]
MENKNQAPIVKNPIKKVKWVLFGLMIGGFACFLAGMIILIVSTMPGGSGGPSKADYILAGVLMGIGMIILVIGPIIIIPVMKRRTRGTKGQVGAVTPTSSPYLKKDPFDSNSLQNKLTKLEDLHRQNLITQEEYDQKRAEYLKEL